jgi:hypothetical protein
MIGRIVTGWPRIWKMWITTAVLCLTKNCKSATQVYARLAALRYSVLAVARISYAYIPAAFERNDGFLNFILLVHVVNIAVDGRSRSFLTLALMLCVNFGYCLPLELIFVCFRQLFRSSRAFRLPDDGKLCWWHNICLIHFW